MRGEASIAGTDFRICYDVNALCAIEEESGRAFTEILAELPSSKEEAQTKQVRFSTIRLLLWGGLMRHHGLSLAQAGDVLSEHDLSAVTAALVKALSSSMPSGKGTGTAQAGEQGNAPAKRRGGTG